MAEGTKLQYVFETSEDKNTTITFKYAKPTATAAQVKALAQALITNTGTLENTLVSVKSAKMVTTTETAYDLSETADPNSRGIPVYEAYMAGIPVDDFDPDQYDENGVLKNTSGEIPPNLKIASR